MNQKRINNIKSLDTTILEIKNVSTIFIIDSDISISIETSDDLIE